MPPDSFEDFLEEDLLAELPEDALDLDELLEEEPDFVAELLEEALFPAALSLLVLVELERFAPPDAEEVRALLEDFAPAVTLLEAVFLAAPPVEARLAVELLELFDEELSAVFLAPAVDLELAVVFLVPVSDLELAAAFLAPAVDLEPTDFLDPLVADLELLPDLALLEDLEPLALLLELEALDPLDLEDALFFFSPPPVCLFTVAQARFSASAWPTPLCSYPSSICPAWRFCLSV